MSPLLFYAIIAGLMGFSIHKKWWGGAAFCLAMLIWVVVIQLIQAYLMHPYQN
jgi:hypothetical protein